MRLLLELSRRNGEWREMRVTVIGAGYVGLVTSACLAEMGHEVIAVERDIEKLELLQSMTCPIHEELLPTLLEKHTGNGLHFSASLAHSVTRAQIIFICVATPASGDGSTDLTQVDIAAEEIAKCLEHKVVIVEKSTVPVHTCDAICQTITSRGGHRDQFSVASNPEFLREGTAVRDFLLPDRIVIGADDDFSRRLLRELYSPLVTGRYYEKADSIVSSRQHRPELLETTVRSAELIKHASNAFLAMKISFINGIANLAEALNADIDAVRLGVGSDRRIGGECLRPGIGFGGACFPKDLTAFAAVAERARCPLPLLDATTRINDRQRLLFVRKVRKAVGSIQDKHIACLGLAFKAGTDDVRNSPAVEVINLLLRHKARIRVFDPAATERARRQFNGQSVTFADDPYETMPGADALVILTEWPQFAALDLVRVRMLLQRPLIIDGRNLYSPEAMRKAGFSYWSCGRQPVPLMSAFQSGITPSACGDSEPAMPRHRVDQSIAPSPFP